MKIIQEIARRNWDFILYETDEGFVINIVFPLGITDTHKSFRLTARQATMDHDDLISLANSIRQDYASFRKIEVIPTLKFIEK